MAMRKITVSKKLIVNGLTMSSLTETMRKVATLFDEQGKIDRSTQRYEYKAREWFDAASKLRIAADATEYVMA